MGCVCAQGSPSRHPVPRSRSSQAQGTQLLQDDRQGGKEEVRTAYAGRCGHPPRDRRDVAHAPAEPHQRLRPDADPCEQSGASAVHRQGASALQAGGEHLLGNQVLVDLQVVAPPQLCAPEATPVVGSLQLGLSGPSKPPVRKGRASNPSSAQAEIPKTRAGYWRNLVCDGCSRRCRYRDFKVFGADAFQETVASLWKNTDDSSEWRYKRRGTILGIMHAHKRDLWEHHTNNCPHYGEEDE